MTFFSFIEQSAWRKRLLIVFLVLFILFTRHFPRYYALANTPKGYTFSGQLSLYDPEDVNLYVAAIRYGQEGHLKLVNQFASLDSKEALIYPVYTFLGYIFRFVEPYLLFNLGAISMGFVLCVGLFFIAQKILGNYWYALFGMFLVVRGGGFGWLLQDKIISADLAFSGIRFATALQRPHEALGILLYITTVVLHFYALREKDLKLVIPSFLPAYFLIILYPYYIVNYVVIAILYTLYIWYKNKTFHHLPVFIMHSAGILVGCILYYMHLHQSGFASDLVESLDKIDIISLLLGYGVFTLLAIPLFSLKQKKEKEEEQFYLILWICISIGLSYSPINFSRLFLRGLFFPLVMLALIKTKNLFDESARKMILLTLVVFLPLTSWFVFSQRMKTARSHDAWTFIPTEVAEGLEVLDKIGDGNVFASFELSNKVPAFTGNRVFFGHPTQSPDSAGHSEQIVAFYSGNMTDEAAKMLLTANKITFVLYGPDENKLGGHRYPFLKRIYENRLISIYTVQE